MRDAKRRLISAWTDLLKTRGVRVLVDRQDKTFIFAWTLAEDDLLSTIYNDPDSLILRGVQASEALKAEIRRLRKETE